MHFKNHIQTHIPMIIDEFSDPDNLPPFQEAFHADPWMHPYEEEPSRTRMSPKRKGYMPQQRYQRRPVNIHKEL